MTWTAGFNFRATAGYVTDGTGETYSIGEAYPTTRSMAGGGASVTFGWNQSVAANSRDRTTASPNAPELSGINYTTSTGSAITFQVDLPSAGSYIIRVAAGDAGAANNHSFWTVFDGTTALITSTETTLSQNNFVDAGLTTRTASAWQSSNTAVTKTFATTTAKITVNVPTANASVLAFFSLTASGGATFIAAPGLNITQAVNRAATF